jgi:hypothetical protein
MAQRAAASAHRGASGLGVRVAAKVAVRAVGKVAARDVGVVGAMVAIGIVGAVR